MAELAFSDIKHGQKLASIAQEENAKLAPVNPCEKINQASSSSSSSILIDVRNRSIFSTTCCAHMQMFFVEHTMNRKADIAADVGEFSRIFLID